MKTGLLSDNIGEMWAIGGRFTRCTFGLPSSKSICIWYRKVGFCCIAHSSALKVAPSHSAGSAEKWEHRTFTSFHASGSSAARNQSTHTYTEFKVDFVLKLQLFDVWQCLTLKQQLFQQRNPVYVACSVRNWIYSCHEAVSLAVLQCMHGDYEGCRPNPASNPCIFNFDYFGWVCGVLCD